MATSTESSVTSRTERSSVPAPMSAHAQAIAACIERWRRAASNGDRVAAEHDAAATLIKLVEQVMPELVHTEVMERSYLVRKVQRYVGPLPDDWQTMGEADRDQFVCDHWLAVEEFEELVDEDDLTLTILSSPQ